MHGTGLIMTLVIGGIAGWLAGQFFKGRGFGVPINILLGVVGAFVGNFALHLVGLTASGLIGQLIAATIGALLILYLARLFR